MRNTIRSVLHRPVAGCVFSIGVLLLSPAGVFAQSDADAAAPLPGLEDALTVAGADQAPQTAQSTDPTNSWARRPVCASMFVKSDWQLTGKQRACDWIDNGVFSTNAMLGAAWSAGFSQRTDRASERGDGFPTRFGRKFAQNAFKSTGSYLGGQIFREDPRKTPPYLAMRTTPRPRGLFKRTAYALGGNFVSYRCQRNKDKTEEVDCTNGGHFHRVPALSRVVGSLASGFAGELLTYDRPDSTRHALRGAASAYGSTFINALFVEFKPELSAFAGKAFTRIFGVR